MKTSAKATKSKPSVRAKRTTQKAPAKGVKKRPEAEPVDTRPPIKREYHKWRSPRLERDMELLVFGHAGTKILMFPTAGGTFYQYEDLRIIDRLRDKIAAGHLQVYCVDSIDGESFYCWWAEPRGRIERHIKYEQYILEEVFPLMEHKNPGTPVISFGCSLGAYHASNIAFRHPHLFCKLCSFSGRFDLTQHMNGFRDLFDGYYDQDVYYHTPAHFIPKLTDHNILEAMRRMDIQIVIGRDDAFYKHNIAFSTTLRKKGISHNLHTWNEEAHRGYYWRRMTSAYV
ncbi:esterase family protein [Cerasicoccus maritimus]|uniref:esterase family protein n=1 Tax=Cerasicoccus maritimus TaxID=490089 RepID=UPI002852572D|nr:alpha/beta hydrolase-fold protein [Cerasicoccus maritimus]